MKMFLAASLTAAVGANCLNIENLVTFGDSLTDEGRLNYLSMNGGNLPPAGELVESNTTASGGLSWSRIVANKMGINTINYAVGGATCSNNITSRIYPLTNESFPSVMEDQIPAFKADIEGFEEKIYGKRTPDNTAYAVWIGANDMSGYFYDAYTPGKTLSDYVDCVWNVFDQIYEKGGRNLYVFNRFPNHHSPYYRPIEEGGADDIWMWPDKSAYNQTQYKLKLMQYSVLLNTAFDYGAPFQLLVEKRWPEATMTVFDAWTLMEDVVENAEEKYASYFDAPIEKDKFFMHSTPSEDGLMLDYSYPYEPDFNASRPNDSKELGKYLWWDDIHPSERFLGVVADAFIEALAGKSKYTTTYTSTK